MKRLVIWLLAAVLVISCGSALADQDPIVGTWYVYINSSDYRGGAEAYQVFMSMFVFFNEDGTVDLAMPTGIRDEIHQSPIIRIGRWENIGGNYLFVNEVHGFQTGVALSGDVMITRITDENYYPCCRLYSIIEAQDRAVEAFQQTD